MNEPQFGNKIRHLLNERLGRVDPAVAERLRAAREQALVRQRPEPAPALAWADNLLGRVDGWGSLSLRILVPLVLLVGGLAGIYSWEQNQRLAEVEDIDAQLLTDDLPVEAYLDRGFQNWLKKQAAEQ
ncbi:MAG TPA: DUF3619 family protein [Burkholderiales bacterium]|nr:DUF3619 family protein [Burkholderiales bacterium]